MLVSSGLFCSSSWKFKFKNNSSASLEGALTCSSASLGLEGGEGEEKEGKEEGGEGRRRKGRGEEGGEGKSSRKPNGEVPSPLESSSHILTQDSGLTVGSSELPIRPPNWKSLVLTPSFPFPFPLWLTRSRCLDSAVSSSLALKLGVPGSVSQALCLVDLVHSPLRSQPHFLP